MMNRMVHTLIFKKGKDERLDSMVHSANWTSYSSRSRLITSTDNIMPPSSSARPFTLLDLQTVQTCLFCCYYPASLILYRPEE